MKRLLSLTALWLLVVAVGYSQYSPGETAPDSDKLGGELPAYYTDRGNHSGSDDSLTVTNLTLAGTADGGGQVVSNVVIYLDMGTTIYWGGTNCMFGFLSTTQAVMRFDMGGGTLSNTYFNAVSD